MSYVHKRIREWGIHLWSDAYYREVYLCWMVTLTEWMTKSPLHACILINADRIDVRWTSPIKPDYVISLPIIIPIHQTFSLSLVTLYNSNYRITLAFLWRMTFCVHICYNTKGILWRCTHKCNISFNQHYYEVLKRTNINLFCYRHFDYRLLLTDHRMLLKFIAVAFVLPSKLMKLGPFNSIIV